MDTTVVTATDITAEKIDAAAVTAESPTATVPAIDSVTAPVPAAVSTEKPDPNKPHSFGFSPLMVGRCDICGLRRKHLIHRQRSAMRYEVGERVGKYVVGKKGEFRRVIE